MSIKIPVNAELNQQDVQQQIQQMQDALNNLGRTAQQAGKIKFNPVNSVTLDSVKKMRAEFDAMVRMSPGLKRALEAGGQGGKSFDEVRWGKVWLDENQRAGHAASMLKRLRPSAVEEVTHAPAPSGTGGSGSGGGGRRRGGGGGGGGDDRTPGTGGSSWRRAAAGGAAGVAGGVASQVGGMAGGVASGALAGGLAGGPIGAIVGGLAGSLTSLLGVIGDARDIAISMDTLKRTLGDTNVSFNDLQGKTRSLADEFSLSDTEAVALTKRYANLSGSDKNLGGLRDEVGVGVGFSRSFGLAPSAGVDFFGQMKGMGITQNADDNKRLALLIGESVAKAGDLPRMADVLAGLSRYMESAARTSLTSPNSAAWLSRFAGLEKSGMAGMDPTTAASIIGSIDGSIRQGGITEAGKNFMNSTLQKDQGLNTIQAAIQLEGGAFGTGRSTFGADSPMSRFYSRFGGGSPLSSWTSDETNVSVLQKKLIKQYEGRPPELMLDAFKNTFGTSYGQAATWMSTDPKQNDAMLKRMQRLGINWKDVNATGVSQLSEIESNSSLSEAQKDAMVKDTASKNQEDTIGSEARKASIDGANAMVRIAEQGLPMLSSIQAGVLKLAGIDPMSPQKEQAKSEHQKRMDAVDNGPLAAEYGKAVKNYKEITPLVKQITGLGLTDEQQQAKDWVDSAGADLTAARKAEDARYKGEKAKLEAASSAMLNPTVTPSTSSTPASPADAAAPSPGPAASPSQATPGQASGGSRVSGATPELLARAAESDRKAGLPEGTTAALMMQESSFNSGAVSSAGARGLHQMMPKNVDTFSRRVGRQLDPTNTEDSFYMYDELMKERKAKYGGNTEKMLRSYHGGYDESKWGAVNEDYVPAIERRKRELAASGQTTASMQHNVNVDVTMRDQSGNKVNDATINTTVGKPTVSGTNP
jgi:soluble lytic murein transglycosylase-like protein